MKKKATPKNCPECKGTGEYRNGKSGPMLKCTECDGTGKTQHFEMIFWGYDKFPYVLAGRGFLRDDGTAYVPGYTGCFRPLKVMSLKDGEPVKNDLDKLEHERWVMLETMTAHYRSRLRMLCPWTIKK